MKSKTLQQVKNYGTKSLRVKDIPLKHSVKELRSFFNNLLGDEIKDISVPIDQYQRSKGFCYISFEEENVQNVLKKINNAPFEGDYLRATLTLNKKYSERKDVPSEKKNSNETEKKEAFLS